MLESVPKCGTFEEVRMRVRMRHII